MPADQSTPDASGDSADYYAQHVAALDGGNTAVCTEDIFNSRGLLVVRAGTRIDTSTAQRIVRHKLQRPLDEQIQLDNLLDASQLRERFEALFEHYPDLAAVFDGAGLRKDFFKCVLTTWVPPLLAQNLTVLEQRGGSVFDKGLFCAAVGFLVARELDLDREQIAAIYLAGLLHDIGLLRIAPSLATREGELDTNGWRALQSHVVIGKLLIERIPALPEGTATAVLEHHERCDGSGYPTGRTEEQLGLGGQVVAMADSVQAIRVNQFESQGLNLANAVPFLQLNASTHFYPVYEVMRGLLKRAELEPARFNVQEGVPTMASRLLERGHALSTLVPVLERIHQLSGELPAARPSRGVGRVSGRILRMIHQSGLLWDELTHWVESLTHTPEPDVLSELNSIDLMQQELNWQIGSLRRSLSELVAVESSTGRAAGRALAEALRLTDDYLAQ